MSRAVHCPSCGRTLAVLSAAAAPKIKCAGCGHVFNVPPPAAPAPPPVPAPPPIAPPPTRWWIRLVSGRQFGPLGCDDVEQWIRDGRTGEGTLVAYEGAGSWRGIETQFPALCAAAASRRRDIYAPGTNPLQGLPATGLLVAAPDDRKKLAGAVIQLHESAHERLTKECERSALGIRFLGSKSLHLRETLPPDLALGSPRLMAENLLFAAFQWMEQEFYLLVPWGRMGQLPHEFFSVLPGSFPCSLALRRKSEHVFDHGVWLDNSGLSDSPLAHSAHHSQVDLTEGLNWRWVSSEADYEMILIWGLQVVPLGARSCLHLLATSMQGTLRRSFGIDWYLPRQHAFSRFRDHLTLDGDQEPHFLFGSTTAQLLARLSEV